MQITNILLPVDGSSSSDDAVRYTVTLAKLSGAKVTMVNCYEWVGHMDDVQDDVVAELKANFEKEAAAVLENAGKMFEEAGIKYSDNVVSGSPGKVISGLARSGEYDLVVMGSKGHTDIGGLFMGSVTHKVLSTLHCPVLIIP